MIVSDGHTIFSINDLANENNSIKLHITKNKNRENPPIPNPSTYFMLFQLKLHFTVNIILFTAKQNVIISQ